MARRPVRMRMPADTEALLTTLADRMAGRPAGAPPISTVVWCVCATHGDACQESAIGPECVPMRVDAGGVSMGGIH